MAIKKRNLSDNTDTASKGLKRTIWTKRHIVSKLQFSPDGTTLAICLQHEDIVRLIDVTLERTFILRGLQGTVNDICFTTDGKTIAVSLNLRWQHKFTDTKGS